MQIRPVSIGNKQAQGVEIQLGKATLVMVIGSKGFLMCGYLNLEAAEKMGETAAIITGVKTIEDILNAPVVSYTTKAKKAGIRKGMTGLKAIQKLV